MNKEVVDKVVSNAFPFLVGAVSVAVSMYPLLNELGHRIDTVNVQLEYVVKTIESGILPTADKRVTVLEAEQVGVDKKFALIQEFMDEGDRFSFADGVRLENKIDSLEQRTNQCVLGIDRLRHDVRRLMEYHTNE